MEICYSPLADAHEEGKPREESPFMLIDISLISDVSEVEGVPA